MDTAYGDVVESWSGNKYVKDVNEVDGEFRQEVYALVDVSFNSSIGAWFIDCVDLETDNVKKLSLHDLGCLRRAESTRVESSKLKRIVELGSSKIVAVGNLFELDGWEGN